MTEAAVGSGFGGSGFVGAGLGLVVLSPMSPPVVGLVGVSTSAFFLCSQPVRITAAARLIRIHVVMDGTSRTARFAATASPPARTVRMGACAALDRGLVVPGEVPRGFQFVEQMAGA